MRIPLLLAAMTELAWLSGLGQAAPAVQSFDYAPLEQVLGRYVDPAGFVDYAGLKQHRAELDQFVSEIRRVSPDSAPSLFPGRDDKLAYWINAYNALVLQTVIDHYPTTSITKIGLIPYGAFFVKKVVLGGKKMTLRSLENDIIRSRFSDPRIHFAINCASRSCPPLARKVYRPATLNEQLNTRASVFINDNRNVTLDVDQRRIVLSRIFDWYASDFIKADSEKAKDGGSVLGYLHAYLTPERQSTLDRLSGVKPSFYDYDWSLNDQAREKSGSLR